MTERTKTIVMTDKKEAVRQLEQIKKMDSQVPGREEGILRWQEKIVAFDQELEDLKIQEKQDKSEDQEEQSASAKYSAFADALKVYHETGMCFHRASQPRFFYKHTYVNKERKTGVELKRSELHFYTVGSMADNWIELRTKTAQMYLRLMMEGKQILLKNPVTEETEYFDFDRRVYTKLGNTRNTPDPNMFNMVDLSKVMKPQVWDESMPIPKIPLLIEALLIALSGSTLDEQLTPSKPEVIDWLERWIYATIYADIGNNNRSMPIIFGKGKVGKNALFDYIIPGILGKDLCFSSVWDIIDSGFNGFKIGKVFMFVDEIPSKEEWSNIKQMTGSPGGYVKEKYGPEFEIDNTISWAMGSNQMSYPLPLEDGKQMIRVSPIAATRGLTFAEVTYKLLSDNNIGFVESHLMIQGVDLSKYPTEFDKGDVFLRLNGDLWYGDSVLQEFLDYLHYKHQPKGDTAMFNLEPLRGSDWEEIIKQKNNPMNRTVEFIIEHNPDSITILEVMDIYRVAAGDPKNDQYLKHRNNLAAEVNPKLLAAGYELNSRAYIYPDLTAKDKRMEGQVWHKPGVSIRKITPRYNKYVMETFINGKTTRELLAPTDPSTEWDSII